MIPNLNVISQTVSAPLRYFADKGWTRANAFSYLKKIAKQERLNFVSCPAHLSLSAVFFSARHIVGEKVKPLELLLNTIALKEFSRSLYFGFVAFLKGDYGQFNPLINPPVQDLIHCRTSYDSTAQSEAINPDIYELIKDRATFLNQLPDETIKFCKSSRHGELKRALYNELQKRAPFTCQLSHRRIDSLENVVMLNSDPTKLCDIKVLQKQLKIYNYSPFSPQVPKYYYYPFALHRKVVPISTLQMAQLTTETSPAVTHRLMVKLYSTFERCSLPKRAFSKIAPFLAIGALKATKTAFIASRILGIIMMISCGLIQLATCLSCAGLLFTLKLIVDAKENGQGNINFLETYRALNDTKAILRGIFVINEKLASWTRLPQIKSAILGFFDGGGFQIAADLGALLGTFAASRGIEIVWAKTYGGLKTVLKNQNLLNTASGKIGSQYQAIKLKFSQAQTLISPANVPNASISALAWHLHLLLTTSRSEFESALFNRSCPLECLISHDPIVDFNELAVLDTNLVQPYNAKNIKHYRAVRPGARCPSTNRVINAILYPLADPPRFELINPQSRLNEAEMRELMRESRRKLKAKLREKYQEYES